MTIKFKDVDLKKYIRIVLNFQEEIKLSKDDKTYNAKSLYTICGLDKDVEYNIYIESDNDYINSEFIKSMKGALL